MRSPEEIDVWTTYATACFLCKDYENTFGSVESIIKFEKEAKKPMRPVQYFEVIVLGIKALEA